MIWLVDVEYEHAIKEAKKYVEREYGAELPAWSARVLIETFLDNLSSEDRDFSDEMLQARKTFRKLTAEQPEECPSKLWDDALASAGRS